MSELQQQIQKVIDELVDVPNFVVSAFLPLDIFT